MSVDRQTTAAVILAGGQARRMGGGDKCLLEVGGATILSRVARALSPAAATALNVGGDPARFQAAGFDGVVLTDARAGGDGPLAGVEAGLAWARSAGFQAIVTASGDAPFPPGDLVERLAGAAAPIAMAASPDADGTERLHPTFALWNASLLPALTAALDGGVRKILAFAEPHGIARVLWPRVNGVDPFFNVNTPEDLAEARRIAADEARR